MATAVLWFRRDLRLSDHPALNAAAAEGPVTALFVLDDALRRPSGAPRLAFLYRSLRSLEAALGERGGALVVRHGRPEDVVPAVVRETGAGSVHVSADTGPYGRRRDDAVEAALGDVPLVRTGSPYAVTPGRVTKSDGTPFKVYSPFYRAWAAHGWPAPARRHQVEWYGGVPSDGIPDDPELPSELELPPAGEDAAHTAWQKYRSEPGELRRGTEPSRPGPHESDVGLPEVRRHPPAHDAAPARQRAVPPGVGVAGLLRLDRVVLPRQRASVLPATDGRYGVRHRPGRGRPPARLGGRAAPGSRSSTPASARCCTWGGCTTGSG